jgi:hypothetical protein
MKTSSVFNFPSPEVLDEAVVDELRKALASCIDAYGLQMFAFAFTLRADEASSLEKIAA